MQIRKSDFDFSEELNGIKTAAKQNIIWYKEFKFNDFNQDLPKKIILMTFSDEEKNTLIEDKKELQLKLENKQKEKAVKSNQLMVRIKDLGKSSIIFPMTQ